MILFSATRNRLWSHPLQCYVIPREQLPSNISQILELVPPRITQVWRKEWTWLLTWCYFASSYVWNQLKKNDPPLGRNSAFSALCCSFPTKCFPSWWMFLFPFLQNAQWWNIHSLSKQSVPGHFQNHCSLLSSHFKTFVLQSIQDGIWKVALSSRGLVLRRHKSVHNVRETWKQIGTATLLLPNSYIAFFPR